MRGNNAGETTNDDHTATPTARCAAPLATLIRDCRKCGSHFEADFEEPLCSNCVAWGELYRRVVS